jgi:DNA ligase-1
MEGLASARVEWKVDGVRAQIHKRGPRVAAFSRQGKELALGALGDGLVGLTADGAVIDSEVALVDAEGRARPFQETFSAISGGAIASGQRLQVFAFDCLHRDGRDLVDEPLTARVEALAQVVPEAMRMPAIVTASVEEAQRFFDDARAHGRHVLYGRQDLQRAHRRDARVADEEAARARRSW